MVQPVTRRAPRKWARISVMVGKWVLRRCLPYPVATIASGEPAPTAPNRSAPLHQGATDIPIETDAVQLPPPHPLAAGHRPTSPPGCRSPGRRLVDGEFFLRGGPGDDESPPSLKLSSQPPSKVWGRGFGRGFGLPALSPSPKSHGRRTSTSLQGMRVRNRAGWGGPLRWSGGHIQ